MSILEASKTKIQTAAIVFAGWLAIWLLGLATLWILAVTTSNKVALTWSLWRIPDTILVFVNLAILALYTGGSSYRPAIVAAIFNAAVILVDVAALVAFCVQYASCVEQINAGDTMTDPLCLTAELKKVGAYHIAIISVLLLGAIGNLIVPFYMFRMATKPYTAENIKPLLTRFSGTSLANTRLRHLSIAHRALTVAIGCVALLAVEVSVLTNASDIKYLWFCHLLMLIPAVGTFFPAWISHDKINKVMSVISIGAFVVSGLGLGLMVWYYEWLCNTEPPRTGFSNFETCEIGRTGAIYMVIIHACLTGISLVRLLACVYALRISASLTASEGDTESVLPNLPPDTYDGSMSQYGQAYRRATGKVLTDNTPLVITSAVSGEQLMC